MEPIRKPFQGVWNVIRFNWHFYVFLSGFLFLLFLSAYYLNETIQFYTYILGMLIISIAIISLVVSFYVYDLSGLYKLNWLNELETEGKSKIVNIHAGFDETSVLFKDKFESSELIVFDFYDPLKHTEVSIKRARKAYPSFPGTRQVNTSNLPIQDNSVDNIFVFLSAHEIRKEKERNSFFNELKRILKPNGKIIMTEHLRDLPNFFAYNIGFFHFIAKSSWYRTFMNAGIKITHEIKITPFITTFILEKYGATS